MSMPMRAVPEKTHSRCGHHLMGWAWTNKREKGDCQLNTRIPLSLFLNCPDVSKVHSLLPQPQAAPVAMFSHCGGLYPQTGHLNSSSPTLQQAHYPLSPFLRTWMTTLHVQWFRFPPPLHNDPLSNAMDIIIWGRSQEEIRALSKDTRQFVELGFDRLLLLTASLTVEVPINSQGKNLDEP